MPGIGAKTKKPSAPTKAFMPWPIAQKVIRKLSLIEKD